MSENKKPPVTENNSSSSLPHATTKSGRSTKGHIHPIARHPHPEMLAIPQNARPSLLQHVPLISFVPENQKISPEMIELEEKLETADHHLKHEEHSHTEHSLKFMSSKESVLVPPGHNVKAPPAPPKARTPKANEREGPAYDWLPRPFRKHWKDLERRRARKMIDIMNSSQEEFNFTDKDRRIRCSPSGTLIFHLLELYNLAVNSTTFIGKLPVSFYCVLSMGPIKRCSKITHSLSARRIRFDYAVNFSVEVSEWRESPLNRFSVEVWSFQDPEIHYIVGSMELHAYDFIRKQHSIEMMELWSDGIKMGKIAYEYAFTYGYFGYCHSNLLKNPKNPIMETVCHSMYPRIRLDGSDIGDKVYKVRMPDKLKLFSFTSLILEMDKQFVNAESLTEERKKAKRRGIRAEDLEPKRMLVQQVEFEDEKPIHCKIHMNIWQKEIEPDFNDAYGEFACISTRKGRLEHLSNLVQGRMKDIYEMEAGWLFRPLKERDAEQINKGEMVQGYLIHPQRIPCPSGLPQPSLDKEDEEFQDKFPSVRREQGYLATLFGYQKKGESNEYLNDMEYPLYKQEPRKKKRKLLDAPTKFRKLLIRIAAYFVLFYNFIFPQVRKESQIPEVSVTTPTPEGSTTKIFTYFVRDQKDATLNKTEKLQAQAAALINMTDSPKTGFVDDDSDNSSSSSEGESKNAGTKAKKGSFNQGKKKVSVGPLDTLNSSQTRRKTIKEQAHKFKASLNQPTYLYNN